MVGRSQLRPPLDRATTDGEIGFDSSRHQFLADKHDRIMENRNPAPPMLF
jgi:hypothetical protein